MDITSASLEAAARAVEAIDGYRGDGAERTVRAAITAYLAAREAEGFVMVPREPTPGMVEAARAVEGCGCPCCIISDDWQAMLSAAIREGGE